MYSKSMLGHPATNGRNMMNPISIPFQNNEYQFSIEYLQTLEKNYMNPVANKEYHEINNDLLAYSDLYHSLSNLALKTADVNMKMLFKISLQGLTGAMHAFHLNKTNIELNVENLVLKKRLETILTGKNRRVVNDQTESKLNIVKTFTLAPLYSYYIILFGMPEHGFDPEKLKQIIGFMNKYHINPYQ